MIRRKHSWALLLLISLLLFSVTAFSVERGFAAPSRTVGVSIGNMFNYTSVFNCNSTDPNFILPFPFVLLNSTDSILISIIDVSGTNVTLQAIWYFKNGGNLTEIGFRDVNSGEGTPGSALWVLAANLNPNDTVYSDGNFVINDTITEEYPDGTRDTNHLNISTESNTTLGYEYASSVSDYYWDKLTGAMVETSTVNMWQTNSSQMSMSWTLKIAESNVWVVPEFATVAFILIALILLTFAIALRKRKAHEH